MPIQLIHRHASTSIKPSAANNTAASSSSPTLLVSYIGQDGRSVVLEVKPPGDGLPRLDWPSFMQGVVKRFFPEDRLVDASSVDVPRIKDGESVADHPAVLSFVKGDTSVADMERQVFGTSEDGSYDLDAFSNVMFWTDLYGDRFLVKLDRSASAA